VGSLWLLGATIDSFAHLLLGLSNITTKWCFDQDVKVVHQVQPSQKGRAIRAVHCKNEEMLLQLLGWRFIGSVLIACPIEENDQR